MTLTQSKTTFAKPLVVCAAFILGLTVETSSSWAQRDAGGTSGSVFGDSGTTGTGETAGSGSGLGSESSFSDSIQRTGEGIGQSNSAPIGGGTSNNATGGGGGAFGGGGGFGGFGGGLGGLFGGAFGGGQNTQSQSAIRTRLRSAVQVAPLPPAQVQQAASRAIRRVPSQVFSPNLRVEVQGRTAFVSGTAKSAKERRMSELLLRLEPGISRVENNIRVQP